MPPVHPWVQNCVEGPIPFGHDVRASGLAEARLAAAVGLRNVFFVPIGTKISAAFQIDGRIYAGSGYASKLAHVDVGHTERWGSGQLGCLEAMASEAAIRGRYEERSGSRACGAEDLIARSAAGDRHALVVWGGGAERLRMGLHGPRPRAGGAGWRLVGGRWSALRSPHPPDQGAAPLRAPASPAPGPPRIPLGLPGRRPLGTRRGISPAEEGKRRWWIAIVEPAG